MHFYIRTVVIFYTRNDVSGFFFAIITRITVVDGFFFSFCRYYSMATLVMNEINSVHAHAHAHAHTYTPHASTLSDVNFGFERAALGVVRER